MSLTGGDHQDLEEGQGIVEVALGGEAPALGLGPAPAAEAMEALESRILTSLNYPCPYRGDLAQEQASA